MERRPTLPVTEILTAERQERSWESATVPGRWGHPSVADRGRGLSDLGMAGLNIGAPTPLQRGGRALPPAGASTPLGGGSGELPRTYSGSSARADYRWRLELNTQDSDEDVLFRQEMNYPERGAGGFSGPRRAGAGESRGSPPVQQLDVSEYMTASEAGSERGRRRHRGYQEDRPSAGHEDIAEASIRRIESLPGAGRKILTRRPMRDISPGADALGRTPRRADHLCRPGTVQACHCRPEDHRSYRLPGGARVCSSPGETTGRGRRLHRSWDLGWRQFRA
jgi:hypothetical protein